MTTTPTAPTTPTTLDHLGAKASEALWALRAGNLDDVRALLESIRDEAEAVAAKERK